MVNSKYEIAELCNQLKLKNEHLLKTKHLNTYQRSRLSGQNEAYDLIITNILSDK